MEREKDDSQWRFPRREMTDHVKKMIFAKCLEIGCRTLFQNHLYEISKRVFRQSKGSPIGVRGSCGAARVVMGMWDKVLKEIMMKERLRSEISFRYVDDLRIFMRNILPGWRWEEWRFQYKEEWRLEEVDMDPEAKTSGEMKKVMDSIFPMLNFEMETPGMFRGSLPTLDFSCYMEGHRVRYTFFQKPMAKKTLIHRRSALGENTKMSSLTQNLMRRMKNIGEDLPMEERIRVVDQFTDQLLFSGYSMEQTKRIIVAGLKGYENLLRKAEKGKTRIHRPAADGLAARKRKKLLGKGNWFQPRKREREGMRRPPMTMTQRKQRMTKESDEIPTVSVLFCPQTPGGQLAKNLQRAENRISKILRERIKVVERGGRMIKDILHKSNPWKGGKCHNKDCLPCANGDGSQDCYQRNCTYTITCMEHGGSRGGSDDAGDNTEEEPESLKEIFRYGGETSHVVRLRSQEHISSYRNMEDKSVLWAHAKEHHGGRLDVKFKMEVHKTWKTALSRMVGEAVLIKRMEEDISINVLNRKGEMTRCNITRLECPGADRDTVKDKGIQEKESEGEKESKVGLGSNDNGGQVVSQEPKLKYLHELYDDFVDNKTKAKPNGKQSKIRKYFTNLTVRDRSEVKALIFETCGG